MQLRRGVRMRRLHAIRQIRKDSFLGQQIRDDHQTARDRRGSTGLARAAATGLVDHAPLQLARLRIQLRRCSINGGIEILLLNISRSFLDRQPRNLFELLV